MPALRSKWTDEDLRYLRENWQSESPAMIADAIQKMPRQVSNKLYQLGFRKRDGNEAESAREQNPMIVPPPATAETSVPKRKYTKREEGFAKRTAKSLKGVRRIPMDEQLLAVNVCLTALEPLDIEAKKLSLEYLIRRCGLCIVDEAIVAEEKPET